MSLLAVVLCGAGLVAAGFPSRAASASSRLFRLAAGAALGIGVDSAYFAARLMASGKPPGPVDEVVLCACGAALWVACHPRVSGRASQRDPAPRWMWALFTIASVVAAAAFVEHSLRFPDGGWDAWMIWNVRARFLVRAADYRTAFSPDLLYIMHQDYPWLLPGAVAQGFTAAGESPLVPVLLAAAFGILAVAVVGFRLAELHGARWGLLGALAILTFPRFLISVADQQSDVPLAVFLALASALVVAATSDRELWLAGFAAGLGMWTKNEGSLYAAALLGAFFVLRRNVRRASLFVLGALPCLALLVWFKTTLAPPNDLAAFSTRAAMLHNALDLRRWGELLYLVARRLVYFQQFGLWLVAAVVAIVLLSRRRALTPTVLALLGACAAFGCVYLLQDVHDLGPLFRTSADRLIVQMWPAFVVGALPAVRSSAHRARTVIGASRDQCREVHSEERTVGARPGASS